MVPTDTFKNKKSDLRDESYDVQKIKNPDYLLLPCVEEYLPLTSELKDQINQGG